MYYIGQILEWKPERKRVLYAGFRLKRPGFTVFSRNGKKLIRWVVPAGQLGPVCEVGRLKIGRFAEQMQMGFFGEIPATKLRKDQKMFELAMKTLEE